MPGGTGGNNPDERDRFLLEGTDVPSGLSRLLTREVRVRYRTERDCERNRETERATEGRQRGEERGGERRKRRTDEKQKSNDSLCISVGVY